MDDDFNVHEGFVEAIAAQGITSGCDQIRYCPRDPVSRGQMASFLARALALPVAGIDWFPDDGGSVHEDAINRVAEAGITFGIGDGTYNPNGEVSRAQMASFLARALGLRAGAEDFFGDDEGNIHEAAINAIAEEGITLGCNSSGAEYCPGEDVQRDQMASFLGRALNLAEVDVPPPNLGSMISVTDGDTVRLLVDGLNEAVQLVGVNAPEIGTCLAETATASLTSLVESQTIRIDVDVSDRDASGQLLRYLFVDGVFVNESLVFEGLAEAVRLPPDTRLAGFLEAAEANAQAGQRGIWDTSPDCTTTTTTVPATTTTTRAGGCDSSYPDFCIPPPPPDLNCPDINATDFQVIGDDPHDFDRDNDGIGCES